MNSGVRDRLYNYEVAPPNSVWEKISTELDESELGAKYPFKLRELAIIPPVQAWHKIVRYLDESSLVNNYAARLAAISVMPPAGTWDKIASELDADSAVLPTPKRTIPWFRYAAAAAIMAMLIWAGSSLVNNKSNEPDVANSNSIPPVQPIVIIPIAEPAFDSSEINKQLALDEIRNDEALEASKKTFAKLDVATRSSKVRNAADFFFASESSSNETTTRGFSFGNDDSDCLELSCRYVMFMTPEGNIIRMSKKLSDLVCCVSGEDQDKDCVDQMKKWREKLAYTPAGHSPGNFIELLNLVSALQEQEP